MFLFGTLFVHPQGRVGISYGKVIQAHGNTCKQLSISCLALFRTHSQFKCLCTQVTK